MLQQSCNLRPTVYQDRTVLPSLSACETEGLSSQLPFPDVCPVWFRRVSGCIRIVLRISLSHPKFWQHSGTCAGINNPHTLTYTQTTTSEAIKPQRMIIIMILEMKTDCSNIKWQLHVSISTYGVTGICTNLWNSILFRFSFHFEYSQKLSQLLAKKNNKMTAAGRNCNFPFGMN